MPMTVFSLPKSTRAAVLHAIGGDFLVEDVPLPSKLEPGAVLVRTEVATLCGSDIHIWKGEVAQTVLPVILGHEMVGTVAALGEGADRDSLGKPLAVGDRLIWASPSCGMCYECTVLEEPVMCPNRLFGSRQRVDPADVRYRCVERVHLCAAGIKAAGNRQFGAAAVGVRRQLRG